MYILYIGAMEGSESCLFQREGYICAVLCYEKLTKVRCFYQKWINAFPTTSIRHCSRKVAWKQNF